MKIKDRIVIALGGNALGKTPIEQQKAVNYTSNSIVDLIEEGYEVILSHGNGPQVGMINLAFENSANSEDATPLMPFPECGAMSQGYIGYHLQNAVGEQLSKRGIDKTIVSIITQVIVGKKDEAFDNPTKPIGSFYTAEEAKNLEVEKGYNMIEDSGRGYRRVVASPSPVDIVEKEIIETLVANDHLVITCGGGGIPVVEEEEGVYKGVEAVIDKDRASEKLAEKIDADILMILTEVSYAAINFGTPKQKNLNIVGVSQMKEYLQEGHFGAGSMKPKVESAIKFVENGGKKAIITSLDNGIKALTENKGTIILSDNY